MLPNFNSNSNGNLENNTSLQDEIELLLLQEQHNQALILERETDLNINRSGSAPPTVEGAMLAAKNLFRNPSFVQFNDGDIRSNYNASNGVLTEEDIRSHPSYSEYYYSNENLNPRLPLPLLSREDFRVAQRVKASGFGFGNVGDSRNKNLVENGKNSSLFSTQSSFLVKKTEVDMNELRKSALRNISQKNSAEFLDRSSVGASGSEMGVRRKSFADILQEGLSQRVTSNLARPSSQNSVGNVSDLMGISNINAAKTQNTSESSEATHLAKALSMQNIPVLGRSPDPIFEIADINASLSGLSISKGQLHTEDSLKPSSQMRGLIGDQEKLVHDTNYSNLTRKNGSMENLNISKSLTRERLRFPRRTLSTTNLQSHVTPPGFENREDLKIRCHGNNFHSRDISFHRRNGYAVKQEPDMITINEEPDMITVNDPAPGTRTGSTEDVHNLRNSNQAQINYPVMDPHNIQQIHGRNMARVFENSQGRYVGNLHDPRAMQALETAYFEALLLQQRQQYESQLLFNEYYGNRGNQMMNSMFQNDINSQHPPSLRNIKEKSTSSLHSKSGNNTRGRFESILDVIKSNKAKSLELSDVLTYIIELSKDQYGSRFIQQKLENATAEERMKIFKEIIPHAHALMIDVFGNYVIQKFFEYGTNSQRKELARHVIGYVLPLSLQMYGCRVIQKVLEVVDVELQAQMVAELDGSVIKCVRDQNGNHVIQKCIECIPPDLIQFIISSFIGQVVNLSKHPYGCRVIQRILEHCVDPKTQKMFMDEIMGSVCNLAQDQYGNYVIQHVLQHGKPHERSVIIKKLAGETVKMSQQKYASNVIEKCLTYGGPEECKLLVNEILGSTEENEPLQAMMKDPFGNYVIQKVLETCDDQNRELILSRIKVHLSALKKYTYGKHIMSRVEKLVATGEKHVALSSSNSV